MWFDGLFLGYRSPYFFGWRPILRQTNTRLEERLAERTRIARDLHDTVLQGLLSASMQLHVAVDQLPANSPQKVPLNRVLELMTNVVEDGRNALCGLRSTRTDSDDLEQAFSEVPHELAVEEHIEFRVIVLGAHRQLHPAIRDEVYRIGREALVNAFRHSRASKIEVELEYAAKRFRLVVRDNGCGIDPRLLHAGRQGHWGFAGMRERAEGVGAKLKIWSRAAAGTELELTVPSRVAFESGN